MPTLEELRQRYQEVQRDELAAEQHRDEELIPLEPIAARPWKRSKWDGTLRADVTFLVNGNYLQAEARSIAGASEPIESLSKVGSRFMTADMLEIVLCPGETSRLAFESLGCCGPGDAVQISYPISGRIAYWSGWVHSTSCNEGEEYTITFSIATSARIG